MRRVSTIHILISLAIVLPAQSQESISAHHHDPPAIIDGATSPELIPDITAYRLFLVGTSQPPDAPPDQFKRQAARLQEIGFQNADHQAVISALGKFNFEYASLINSYNAAATTAWTRGERTDARSFLLQRDSLVQATIDALKKGLSLEGWTRLEAHIKAEKRFMKISAPGVTS